MSWPEKMEPAKYMSETITEKQPQQPSHDWRVRVRALTNIPPVLKMVWESAPMIVSSSIACRVVAALVPLAMLAVTRFIIDSINGLSLHSSPLPAAFWWFVGLEF